MTKTILSFIAGFGLGIILIWGWNTYGPKDTKHIDGESTVPTEITPPSVEPLSTATSTDSILEEDVQSIEETSLIQVKDQAASGVVRVETTTLPQNGWLVVHEEIDGKIANALGALRKDAGSYSAAEIPLLRSTAPGRQYWIVMYTDNGDREFSLVSDTPARTADGSPVLSVFNAL